MAARVYLGSNASGRLRGRAVSRSGSAGRYMTRSPTAGAPRSQLVSAYLYEIFETEIVENRKNPRYQIAERGAVRGVQAEVRSISRGGAQFAFSHEAFAQFQDLQVGKVVATELQFELSLALDAQVVYIMGPQGNPLGRAQVDDDRF